MTNFFTGRVEEVAAIEAAVDAVAHPQDVHAIFVIHGMPGVGKSVLAQYVAHRLVAMFSSRTDKPGCRRLPVR